MSESVYNLAIMSENWLCLQVQARQEYALSNALNSLKIPAYTPRYQRIQQVFFQRKLVVQPLFLTYLFASPEYHIRKSAVRLLPTSLKSRVVGEIETGLLDEMQEREDSDGFIILSKADKQKTAQKPFQQGDPLIYHRLSNFEAVFDSYTSDTERIIILATMFNQTVRIPVSLADVAFAV